ncbi:hypothetical protein F3J27_16415 [Enterobacter sp. Ap-916]|uniref:hypothetical protein n=1 Tax=Enterobacteriaceae TaxID=543 RepID=UPI0012F4D4DF|nr:MULTISPECIES: hypothetical protein [unclassified Enterobacter]NIF59964.1 hypothetical protein [Enterobacter sp. Ap-867]NIG31064.1 hypothetical protein [Enterobacter sp. Ap-916]
MKAYLSVLCTISLIMTASTVYADAVEARNTDSFSSTLATFSGSNTLVPTSIKESTIVEMKDRLEKLQSNYDGSVRKIDEQETRLDEMKNKLSQMESKANEQQSKMDSLKRDNEQLSRKIDELAQKIK